MIYLIEITTNYRDTTMLLNNYINLCRPEKSLQLRIVNTMYSLQLLFRPG